ncbi:tyrosine-type recombinase/integrase [Sphingorhabdus sp.]|uniref:tyrosine-type recombinase/integrase n=1 Tax=Sphingorhabdus sp. TaxID=1902408 RepID=UPI0037C5D5BE
MGKLTAISVKAAMKVPGTYQDGDGLILKVRADKEGRAASAQWTLRVQRDGKRSDIGLGSAKLITLETARTEARKERNAVKVERRDILIERKDAAAAQVTFREAAKQYHAENEKGWKSKTYARQWLAALENYAFPKLGEKTTGAIVAADIITTLHPIWQDIPETARQVRNRICVVLDYAHAKGWRSSEAPSGNGSLKAGRGLPRQVKEQVHRKAMPYAEIPSFIAALQRKHSYGRLGLELLILTGVRSQEARLATWDEFDLEAGLWAVPADHMKRAKAHIVPLSQAAVSVLQRAAALRLAGSEYVFPGAEGRAMSDMTLLKVLRDAGEPFHVHGFRSAFTDWAANEGFPEAVVEAALAHKTPDAVQAAYRRTTYLGTLDKPGDRVRLMDAWGTYCASVCRAAPIVSFRLHKN